MKLKIFDRTKYNKSLLNLYENKAPTYIVEAYLDGYTDVVNEYFKNKFIIERQLKPKASKYPQGSPRTITETSNLPFIEEARKKRDEDFLKAFFVMTNLDIVTGKKLPPKAGNLLKDTSISLGLKDLYKKLR